MSSELRRLGPDSSSSAARPAASVGCSLPPLGLATPSSQGPPAHRGLMAANRHPIFWSDNFPQLKACSEMFTLWELLATFGEKQLKPVSSIPLLSPHAAKEKPLSLQAI